MTALTPPRAWVRERDSYIDAMNEANRRYLGISYWARHLAEHASGSPCHLAAINAATRANHAWIAARESLDDLDYADIAAHRAAHLSTVKALLSGWREANHEC